MRKRRPTHPGVILSKHYLQQRGLTLTRFAVKAGLSRKHVSNIVHGRVSVTPRVAVSISGVLGTFPEFWMNLQNAVDLYDARARLGA